MGLLARIGLAAAIVGLGAPAASFAQADERDHDLLTLSTGWFNFSEPRERSATDLRVEYRFGRRVWLGRPWTAAGTTSAGALYGGAGVLLEIPLGRRLLFVPALGVNAYDAGGEGKDLGHAIEFRETAELGYRLADGSLLSVSFEHMSNAGIGERNPGANTLAVKYSIPVFRGRRARAPDDLWTATPEDDASSD
jgi:hypothetical protein